MSLLNWRLPVADKEMFWDTLKTNDGWKFQHNKVIGQYRVVSPGKYREAWGFDHNEILKDFKRLSGFSETKNTVVKETPKTAQPEAKPAPSKIELWDELEKVSDLYQKGILKKEEFEHERNIIMNKIKTLP